MAEERYYSLNCYLRERFGTKVYKLALDGGMTCPNRDGRLGWGGCIFCSAGGSGEFAARKVKSVSLQLEEAKKKVAGKIQNGRYIAYFQSYTNTYASVDYLEELFTNALFPEEIVGLSIATRPDCLPDPVLNLLSRLNQWKPIWVELGLQTIHEETARYIRRGYPLSTFEQGVKRLKEAGTQVVAHVILGLPGESREAMLETVDFVGHSGVDGIKLQLLHVLKGTDLALEYEAGRVAVLDMDAYIDILLDCIERLPPDLVIHRLTGDGPKNILLAPLWSADKKRVLNALRQQMEIRQIRQGKFYTEKKDTL